MKQIFYLLLTFFVCGKVAAQNDSRPFVLGKIMDITSTQLGEKRTLNVYLPEGYSADDTSRYPVIYLLDGSADEDFIHIAGLVQFANFPWVNLLPPTIVVGIANVDRKRDFTYPTRIEKDKKDYPTTGGSAKFIAFVEQELQPFVEKNFRCNQQKTLIGQSLGGLLGAEVLYKKTHLFNRYILISPSLWWDGESLLALPQPKFTQPTTVFVGVGKEGKVMVGDAKRFVKILRSIPAPTLNVHFEYFPNENHASILHQAVYQAFEVLQKK